MPSVAGVVELVLVTGFVLLPSVAGVVELVLVAGCVLVPSVAVVVELVNMPMFKSVVLVLCRNYPRLACIIQFSTLSIASH